MYSAQAAIKHGIRSEESQLQALARSHDEADQAAQKAINRLRKDKTKFESDVFMKGQMVADFAQENAKIQMKIAPIERSAETLRSPSESKEGSCRSSWTRLRSRFRRWTRSRRLRIPSWRWHLPVRGGQEAAGRAVDGAGNLWRAVRLSGRTMCCGSRKWSIRPRLEGSW